MTKSPITAAQAMRHPAVVETINTLGQMADELRSKLEKAEKDAARCKRFIDEVCEETFDTWTNGYRMQQVAMNIKAAMEASK